jgi:ribosomal protein S27AE
MTGFTVHAECPNCGWGPLYHKQVVYANHGTISYQCGMCMHKFDEDYTLREGHVVRPYADNELIDRPAIADLVYDASPIHFHRGGA